MAYNLVGFKTRQLIVVEKLQEKSRTGKTQWLCKCFCGNETILPTHELTKIGGTESCGKCEWHVKHKDAYISWQGMIQRCDDASRKDYKYYGGRGITYDKAWGKFINFFKDMGDPPFDLLSGERMSLDRINTNGNYSKENCKWSTRSEQQLNKQCHYEKERMDSERIE